MSSTRTAPVTVAKSTTRPSLDDLRLSTGKKARLHRLLYQFGCQNGTLLALPIDQGLEHGPVDFFDNPSSGDPHFQFQLAIEGGFNLIACQIGLAERYYPAYAGEVPLLLKLNGRTNIPPSDEPLSPCTSSVEDAVRLGADAVGYTLYVGSSRQEEDFIQLGKVRQDCDRYGMPLVIWSYPRGKYMDAKGGRDSLYAVDYAARVAREVGADVVKLNAPKSSDKDKDQPKPYPGLDLSYEEAVAKVVESAGETMVLFSGGSKISDQDLIDKVRVALESGATGLIFGRNMWQRPLDEALRITGEVKELLRQFPAPRPRENG